MKEIIHISVGQCGNQVGEQYWRAAVDEHSRFASGGNSASAEPVRHYPSVLFHESATSYIPRAILIDSEPSVVGPIIARGGGGEFRRENVITGLGGTGNCWAAGYNWNRASGGRVSEAVRAEAERCDGLSQFQLLHSLGGGTGSGMGSWLVELLRDEYPRAYATTCSIAPAAPVSSVVVEPYNAVLALSTLIDQVDGAFLVDNRAIARHCHENAAAAAAARGAAADQIYFRENSPHAPGAPSFDDLNRVLSGILLDLTAATRFSSEGPAGIAKQLANIEPYSHLHLFTLAKTHTRIAGTGAAGPGAAGADPAPSTASTVSPSLEQLPFAGADPAKTPTSANSTVEDLLSALLQDRCLFLDTAAGNPAAASGPGRKSSRILGCAAVVRARDAAFSAVELERAAATVGREKFADLAARHWQIARTVVEPATGAGGGCAAAIINTTAVSARLHHLAEQAEQLLARGAYMHHFLSSDVDQDTLAAGADLVHDFANRYAAIARVGEHFA